MTVITPTNPPKTATRLDRLVPATAGFDAARRMADGAAAVLDARAERVPPLGEVPAGRFAAGANRVATARLLPPSVAPP